MHSFIEVWLFSFLQLSYSQNICVLFSPGSQSPDVTHERAVV